MGTRWARSRAHPHLVEAAAGAVSGIDRARRQALGSLAPAAHQGSVSMARARAVGCWRLAEAEFLFSEQLLDCVQKHPRCASHPRLVVVLA